MAFLISEAEVHEDEIEDAEDAKISSALPENLSHVPFTTYVRYGDQEMTQRSAEFYDDMNNRRTCRYYSSEPVPKEVIENIVKTAGRLVKQTISPIPHSFKMCTS